MLPSLGLQPKRVQTIVLSPETKVGYENVDLSFLEKKERSSEELPKNHLSVELFSIGRERYIPLGIKRQLNQFTSFKNFSSSRIGRGMNG